MAKKTPRHRVFVSFHERDIKHKEKFVDVMRGRMLDRSVDTGSIDDTGRKTDTIRNKIRDEYIRDATVTVVLIGPCTWQRKHVDWEIGGSLRRTRANPRCGLLGILLPNHPDFGKRTWNLRRVPPRLADNAQGDDPYALIYDWPEPWAPAQVAQWIHRAFVRRDGSPPDQSRPSFGQNHTRRRCRQGWN
ncbi:MAG: TIR domain-containing protein [Chloroflexota bacterium]|nr:TIR domain-containing protein [Chloroflexota bacterium]